MAHPEHLALTTTDPYAWRESVLSTRSLSYMSNISTATATQLSQHHARNVTRPSIRTRASQSTITSYSADGDFEMADGGSADLNGLDDIMELPDSVAHSKLFELPREIRDRIYSFCLTPRDAAPVEWPSVPARPYQMQAQLLRTCRIIHDEATAVLYDAVSMIFHHPSDSNMFARAMASPVYARYIVNLSLHIKAQEMRMWMPYLTSTDAHRSLRSDFPHLKELGIRFRSNKWQHQHPPEINLRNWSDDGRLDELIDGLRQVYLPRVAEALDRWYKLSDPRYPGYDGRPGPNDPNNDKPIQQYVDACLYHSSSPGPVIRVCCACRVQMLHFRMLTTPAASTPNQVAAGSPNELPPPVQEGEAFRGFLPHDFLNSVKRLVDPELGSANVARTPYANRHGILLALEVHCLDPKSQQTARSD